MTSLSSMNIRFLEFWVLSIFILCLPATLMAAFPFSIFDSSPPPPLPLTPPAVPAKPVKPRVVRCRSPLFPRCFNLPFLCPLPCLTNCFVNCNTCRPVCSCDVPGAVCQDPRFVGGDGNTFYFHGHKDQNFCLVSDTNLHVNGHFIGKRNPNLRRDFTWVQAIGIMFDNHKILVAANKTSTWDDNVDRLTISFDGHPISLATKEGSKWEYSAPANITITRTSNNNGLIVEVLNNLKITANVVPITAEESRIHGYDINDDDCFAHLELGFKLFTVTSSVDGVLGQTYRSNYVSKVKVNAAMPVMGGAHKYLTSGLFSTDCAVSRFGGNVVKNANSALSLYEYPVLNCKSGIDGNGLVCK
ncbi:hypothetical protein ACH5RR_019017 [Cinchona calisaya]|uniref:Root cap n=1 Tax=Cinchona calisaya TaxID=153742 RepID=A0ABD2ZPE8_9GENT